MKTCNIVFQLPDSLGGLFCSANRYTQTDDVPENGLTLIFAHCASAHKEQWEITIKKLFELISESCNLPQCRIREAWALDCQSHGDSALLNHDKLRDANSRAISIEDYGDLLRFFTRSEYVAGHRLVAIGHSASTSAW
ncbi:hypothetical protein AcV5_009817 [Taiwanofungus camphoratus]|nr:hypothetical protein AcV5_009817 [Antrodia cinnamomea]